MTQPVLHPKTKEQLDRIIQAPPQALLLLAPQGAGKQTVAEYIAATLLDITQSQLPNSAACMIMTPTDQSLGIEKIRDIQHFMLLKAHGAQRTSGITRLALVIDAHLMTREAQNALLKTLEEPPVGSMIILTAQSKQSLLPTIVSRCQSLTLTRPDAEQIMAAAPAGTDKTALTLALRISDGWPGLALAMLDDGSKHPLADATDSARELLKSSQFERLARVDQLSKKREQCEAICFILEQMAHIALQSASGTSLDRWQRVLQAAYNCNQALRVRGNTKLAMTQLMLAL